MSSQYHEVIGVFVVAALKKIACLYVIKKAGIGLNGYLMQSSKISWAKFSLDLFKRFNNWTYSEVIEEFNKLVHYGTMKEYKEKFEE